MIRYEYRCELCSELTEALREIEERNDCPKCDHCGGKTKKIISKYYTHGDIDPYYDENLDSFVRSKQHRKQIMRDQGVSEKYGQGWYTSAKKSRKVG